MSCFGLFGGVGLVGLGWVWWVASLVGSCWFWGCFGALLDLFGCRSEKCLMKERYLSSVSFRVG